ncbi:STAS domain-containing protein [Oleiharenicola sp. Vm1]|uniref:STAS domain-containing protein n=1 Tax=Oleiharenicola sp. Vm1 TaxID=3398393 RepID=UPI0039F62A12
MGLSVGLFLQKASEPSLVEYAVDDAGALRAAPARAEVPPQISIVHVEGDLFFGAADPFHDQVRQLAAEERVRVVILRLKNARLIDASTVLSLVQLREYLHGTGRHLLLSGVMPPAMRVLRASGALAELGEENVFVAEENPTVSTKRALQRAQALLGAGQPEIRLFYDTPPAPAGAQ